MKEPHFRIAAVERDVGLSKDVLRVWERRYGFLLPERDLYGERLYPSGQVLLLRLIKLLKNMGHRQCRLMSTTSEELQALASGAARGIPADDAGAASEELESLLLLIRQNEADAYLQAMQQRL